MNDDSTSMLISLLPMLLVSIPPAIGNFMIAGRLGKSKALWFIITLIPLFGLFFNFYVWYSTLLTLLDRSALTSSQSPPQLTS